MARPSGSLLAKSMEAILRVLIVEDNPSIRRLLRRAVLEVATAVQDCNDGAQALAAYSVMRPDIVLMDVRMPVLDGLAATRQIRAVFPTARIVMVTDYDDEGLRSAAADAGACGYTLKENMTDLPQQLCAILNLSS